MSLQNNIHMNGGDGDTSYANNSSLQKNVIVNTLPVLNKAIKEMCSNPEFHGSCLKMVDLGCSSGPNTLFLISHVLNAIKAYKFQEIQVFLNDLPGNDFNNLFKSVQKFLENGEMGSKCFIYGLPLSFYERLFPKKTLHFAYSSYSIHWLSQVPENLGKMNMENIYILPRSSKQVYYSYLNQYQKDFFRFLRFRGEEMISGGFMVLSFIGRDVEDAFTKDEQPYYTLLAESLFDMADKNVMEDLYSFNIPIYTPCQDEAEAIISQEGSFNLVDKESFGVPWEESFDKKISAKSIANSMRALFEPIIDIHFDRAINCDYLFELYAEKVEKFISKERYYFHTIVLSLKKI